MAYPKFRVASDGINFRIERKASWYSSWWVYGLPSGLMCKPTLYATEAEARAALELDEIRKAPVSHKWKEVK